MEILLIYLMGNLIWNVPIPSFYDPTSFIKNIKIAIQNEIIHFPTLFLCFEYETMTLFYVTKLLEEKIPENCYEMGNWKLFSFQFSLNSSIFICNCNEERQVEAEANRNKILFEIEYLVIAGYCHAMPKQQATCCTERL